MPNSVDFGGKPFHFIGVGGIGMSALAYVLARRGLPVSGSDLRLSHITQRLQDNGVHVFLSQDPANLEFFQDKVEELDASLVTVGVAVADRPASRSLRSITKPSTEALPQVVCSTAIHPENAEYLAAQALGCSILHRSDVLAGLIQEYRSIAVAGTHGKTTTSSMIGYMLWQAGVDPTIVVGGEVDAWQGNARLGQGEYLVAEADESDGSLVKLAAEIGIITNIELDHPDHYSSLEQVIDTFQQFAQNCTLLVGSIDCPTVRDRFRPTISYSLDANSEATYRVDQVSFQANGTTARVWERGHLLGEIKVKLLGCHNLSNALAAVAVGRLLGLDFATIAAAISTFVGARRRFEHRGEHNGILFVDDYAHHPSELRATLAAARLRATGSSDSPWKRVVAIFQPHRYSRTQKFLDEFAESFGDADVVVLTDIYSAGESNPGQITGRSLADQVASSQQSVYYEASLQSVSQRLKTLLVPGDIALFLGAGNLNQLIPDLMEFFQRAEK